MKLNKLHVLEGETSTSNHSISISGTRMSGGTRKIRTSIPTRRQNSLMGAEPVQSAVFQTQRQDTATFTVLHDQVESEVFDKVVGVVAKGLAVEGV